MGIVSRTGVDWAPIVTHFKIFRNYDTEGHAWEIDGRDDYGNYTDGTWSFDTFEQAVAAIPEFATALRKDRVRIAYRNHGLVQVIGVRCGSVIWEYLDQAKAWYRYGSEIAFSEEKGSADKIELYVGVRRNDCYGAHVMLAGGCSFPHTPPTWFTVMAETEVRP